MFSNNGTEKSLQNSLFLKNFLTRYFLTKKKIFTGIYPKDCYFVRLMLKNHQKIRQRLLSF